MSPTPPPSPSGPGHAGGVLRRLTGDLRPGEGRVAWAAALWFFCLLAAYYALRPMRDAFGAENPYELHWLFTGTFLLTMIAQPLYGRLVARHGRAVFLPLTYRFLLSNVVLFAVLLGTLEGEALRWAHRLYFVWLSVFVVFGVSVFWAFLADLMGARRAKRLYGLIAVGGTLGAAFGSSIAGWWVEYLQDFLASLGASESVGRGVLLPALAALFLEGAVRAARRVERMPLPPEEDDPEVDSAAPVGGRALAGFGEVARSNYLLGICGYVAVFVLGSTLLYFINSVIVQDAFASADERTSFFGKVDFAVNGIALFLQLFATGRVLQRLGLGIALAAVPLVGVIGFSAVALSPTIAVLVVFFVSRRAAEFGFSKPARDALFTAVTREEKYKAKAIVDTAVYRGGDAVAMWLQAGLTKVGVGLAATAWGLVGVCAAGLGAALFLGREHARRTARRAETPG